MEASNENDVVPSLRNRMPHLLRSIKSAIVSGNLARLRELFEEMGHAVLCSCIGLRNHALHGVALWWTEEHTQLLEYLLSLDEIEKDARNSKGETPLILFTKKKLKTPAEMLIKAGANVTIADGHGYTPLHYSVRYNREVSHQLILAGADINHEGDDSETPLHRAIRDLGDLEIVCMLLYYGADTSIETTNQYLTPFMLSLLSKKTDIALQLFEYVTDFNLKTKSNCSTLLLAVRSGFPRIIDMCQRGADINNDENPDRNMFNLGIIPKPEVFRYLWPRFDCDHWPDRNNNILTHLGRSNEYLSDEEVVEILLILFINDDLKKITLLIGHLSSRPAIYLLVNKLYDAGVSKDMLHTLIACMLMCNVVVNELDLDMVYEYYGYCEAFKLLLYMDIQPNPEPFAKPNLFPSLIYRMSWHHEFEDFTWRTYINDSYVGVSPYPELVDYEKIFDHLLCLKLKRKVLRLCQEQPYHDDDDIAMRPLLANYLSQTPNVPLLKELARNKSRDFICERFKIKTCCMFYTILHHLELYNFVKQLIAFEKPLYKNYFEQKHPTLKNLIENTREIRLSNLYEFFQI